MKGTTLTMYPKLNSKKKVKKSPPLPPPLAHPLQNKVFIIDVPCDR
jgi:hypothetical protein